MDAMMKPDGRLTKSIDVAMLRIDLSASRLSVLTVAFSTIQQTAREQNTIEKKTPFNT
jgi:hypothetical protein